MRFLLILLLALCLFCSSCDSTSSPKLDAKSNKNNITELNVTYEGESLKITATDITATDIFLSEHMDTLIMVGVKFVIENISNSDYYVKDGETVEALIDNTIESIFMLNPLNLLSSENNEYLLEKAIAPGTRSEGYCSIFTYKETQTVNFRFLDGYDSNDYIYFTFDIPPINTDSTSALNTDDVSDTSDVPEITGLLTLEKYNQIEIGMTYDEVKEIIGSDGSLSMEIGDKGTDYYMAGYIWEGSGDGSASLVFGKKDAKLLSKSQHGLE